MPEIDEPVSTVAISCDGANVLILDDGYREAMTGAISLYSKAGERLHSMYVALDPEYGKARFFKRMDTAISDIKKKYPNALYLGVSDGAKDLWKFLKKEKKNGSRNYIWPWKRATSKAESFSKEMMTIVIVIPI